MDQLRVNELIYKYAEGTATKAEEAELMEWYRAKAGQEAVFHGDEQVTYHELSSRINHATGQHPTRAGWKRWAVAASVAALAVVGATLYFYSYPGSGTAFTAEKRAKPGSNDAILTLANGKQIVLSGTDTGKIATQGNISVTKAANGQLVYHVNGTDVPAGESAAGVLAYNTIKTPAGGQYKVVLPDGTEVWLNAMSTLKFPLSFSNAKERRVELAGEAFFEVVHNDDLPFRVVTGAMVTEDIGTAFNIKAYADENSISTTLVNGAARVIANNSEAMLRPGQQASFLGKITVREVNVEDITAWKDGYFRFDDVPLESIAKNMARWYNVRFVFEDDDLKMEPYGLVATRLSDISVLLGLMEKAGAAQFRLEGTTVIVSKK